VRVADTRTVITTGAAGAVIQRPARAHPRERVKRPGRNRQLRLLRGAFPLVLGSQTYLITTPEGMPVAWCLADPKFGEREVAAEPFAHARDIGALSEKMIMLADKRLSGAELERYWADQLGVVLVRPDRKDEQQRRYGNLAGMRQWIEAGRVR
jgi:hypothetical protein